MWVATFICLSAVFTAVYGTVIVYTQSIPHAIMEEFEDMPAFFGPDIPAEGLRGFLVAGEPADGCGNMTRPPAVTDNFTDRWFVLVAKHKEACSYETQVRNAQAAGYDFVIVHNVNSSDLVTMTGADADDILIPSVFVSDFTGLVLAEEYLYDKGFYIMVNSKLPYCVTHLLLAFAILVGLCLIIILIFMIVKCVNDRRRAARQLLPARSLSHIPTYKFSKGDPYDTCAICLDDYQGGDRLRVLPCAHAYHAACIDPWLTRSRRVCPVCKRRVLVAGERRASDSSDDSEPLLAAPRVTQGGTFDEQRENPFARATRFMARLRARHERGDSEAGTTPPSSVGHIEEANNENDENGNTSETAPLVPARAAAVSERRARRARRQRSVRDPRAPHVAINTSARGEIGVAALPAAGGARAGAGRGAGERV